MKTRNSDPTYRKTYEEAMEFALQTAEDVNKNLSNGNVLRFYGAFSWLNKAFVVTEFGSHRSLDGELVYLETRCVDWNYFNVHSI